MLKHALIAVFAIGLISACSPIRQYHGYLPDDAQPNEIEPGEDTRSTVLARLGSPSTKSIFDDNTWFYSSEIHSSFAYFKPKVQKRDVIAIRFGDDDYVSEILEYDVDDGQVVRYASNETATLGRQLSLLEQLFGSVGTLRLPNSDENLPGQVPGQ